MSRFRRAGIRGARALRLWQAIFAIALAAVCRPALAFDEGALPTASESTIIALKNQQAAPAHLAVPYASTTIFDSTPPQMGTASSPAAAPASAIPVTFSGMTDAVSGLKTATLWVRYNDGGWARTAHTSSAGAGRFTFNPNGIEGRYYFAFRLEDQAGNLSPVPSGIGLTSTQVDGTPPVITLLGSARMTIAQNTPFTDPGASATDAVDGDLSSHIVVTGKVDSAKPSTYTLRYNVSDRAGNAAQEVTRTVTVQAPVAYLLSIPTNLNGPAGATVACPIHLSETQGLTSFRITLLFNGELLQVASVSPGTATSSWVNPTVTSGSGSVSISASGAALGSGSGTVAVLNLAVNKSAASGQTSSLRFVSASLNGGATPTSVRNGEFTVTQTATYLYGDANGDGRVNHADAVHVLKRLTGLVKRLDDLEGELTDAASDVSGDDPMHVGTIDASLIMRFSEGQISQFPADLDGNGTGPESTNDKAAVKAAIFQEYGDPARATRILNIPGTITLEPGASYEIPVSVDMGARVRGYFFELLYDARALEYVNIRNGSLTEAWIQPIVNVLPGKIAAANAHTHAGTGQGSLAILTLRALPTVTPGATTHLRFETAELNDGLLSCERCSGAGEPVITGLAPQMGAETGGTVVRITGASLRDISRVWFGNTASPWIRCDRAGNSVLAVTPGGSGAVNVTVESSAGTSALTRGFTYFAPQVHLTLAPIEPVISGNPLEVPVWFLDLSGGQVSTVTFDLCFDPVAFAVKQTDGAFAAAEESAIAAGKTVTANRAGPGVLRVTVDGAPGKSIGSGLLATCHLLAIAADEEASSLLYISEITTADAGSKSFPASASPVND
ncbi:MAG: cohesin domain-containing protein [Candidatus Hydrogenedentales bacterium]|jgi:hypothetical protein